MKKPNVTIEMDDLKAVFKRQDDSRWQIRIEDTSELPVDWKVVTITVSQSEAAAILALAIGAEETGEFDPETISDLYDFVNAPLNGLPRNLRLIP